MLLLHWHQGAISLNAPGDHLDKQWGRQVGQEEAPWCSAVAPRRQAVREPTGGCLGILCGYSQGPEHTLSRAGMRLATQPPEHTLLVYEAQGVGGPNKLCLNSIYTTVCLSSIFNLSTSFMFTSPSAAKPYLRAIQRSLAFPSPALLPVPLLQHLDRFVWKRSFAIFFLECFPLAFISPGYPCQSFCPSSAQTRNAGTLCSHLSPLPPLVPGAPSMHKNVLPYGSLPGPWL